MAVHGRNVERGEAVVRAITDAGGSAHFFPADLSGEDACTALVDSVAGRFGGLTVLVNNAVAGSGGRSPIGDFDTVLWERILRVNLTSPAWLCRAAISHMRRPWVLPRVITTSNSLSLSPWRAMPAPSTSRTRRWAR